MGLIHGKKGKDRACEVKKSHFFQSNPFHKHLSKTNEP